MLCEGVLERVAQEHGLTVLGWRDTPINGDMIGRLARNTQPYIEQIFRPARARTWIRTRSSASCTSCASKRKR